MDEPIYTVDNLNPRGQVVKGMEMSVRRSRLLGALCSTVLAQAGDPRTAERTPPWLAQGVTSTALNNIFGKPWYRHEQTILEWWPWMFWYWYSGGMEKAEQAAMLNLPSDIQERLRGKS